MNESISSAEMLLSYDSSFLEQINKHIKSETGEDKHLLDTNTLPKNINIITLLIHEKRESSSKQNCDQLTLLKTFPILNAKKNSEKKELNFL